MGRSPENFLTPLEKCVGHRWTNYWTQFKKFGPLSENSSPPPCPQSWLWAWWWKRVNGKNSLLDSSGVKVTGKFTSNSLQICGEKMIITEGEKWGTIYVIVAINPQGTREAALWAINPTPQVLLGSERGSVVEQIRLGSKSTKEKSASDSLHRAAGGARQTPRLIETNAFYRSKNTPWSYQKTPPALDHVRQRQNCSYQDVTCLFDLIFVQI